MLDVGALQQKILRQWTKFDNFGAKFIIYAFSARLHQNWLGGGPQIWYHRLAHLSQMKDLLFVCRYVEPFRSYEFPFDGRSSKFVEILWFSPPNFLGVENKNFEKYVILPSPTRILCENFVAIR